MGGKFKLRRTLLMKACNYLQPSRDGVGGEGPLYAARILLFLLYNA